MRRLNRKILRVHADQDVGSCLSPSPRSMPASSLQGCPTAVDAALGLVRWCAGPVSAPESRLARCWFGRWGRRPDVGANRRGAKPAASVEALAIVRDLARGCRGGGSCDDARRSGRSRKDLWTRSSCDPSDRFVDLDVGHERDGGGRRWLRGRGGERARWIAARVFVGFGGFSVGWCSLSESGVIVSGQLPSVCRGVDLPGVGRGSSSKIACAVVIGGRAPNIEQDSTCSNHNKIAL